MIYRFLLVVVLFIVYGCGGTQYSYVRPDTPPAVMEQDKKECHDYADRVMQEQWDQLERSGIDPNTRTSELVDLLHDTEEECIKSKGYTYERLDPAKVSHPDEIRVDSKGKASFQVGITGEDVIFQVRGTPKTSYSFTASDKNYKVLIYNRQEDSPEKGARIFLETVTLRGKDDVILLQYDPAYGVYVFNAMEELPSMGYGDDVPDCIKQWAVSKTR